MRYSLNKKAILLVICIGIIVGTFAIAIYNKGLYDFVVSQYGSHSAEITKLVAVEIDADRLTNVQKAVREIYDRSENRVTSDEWGTPQFEAYLSQFEPVKEMNDYKTLLSDLRRMQDQLDVDCLYITWVDVANECYVYLVDAAYEDPCPPGCIDPLYAELTDPTLGSPPNITNTPDYGWLITTGTPIYNDQGEIIGMSAVDISMNSAMIQVQKFMLRIGIAFLILIFLVCVVAIFIISRYIVRPINSLSRAAADYKNNKDAFSGMLEFSQKTKSRN